MEKFASIAPEETFDSATNANTQLDQTETRRNAQLLLGVNTICFSMS